MTPRGDSEDTQFHSIALASLLVWPSLAQISVAPATPPSTFTFSRS